MPPNRSISQRIKRAKSIETKREIIGDWANSWKNEQCSLIIRLGQAVKDNDYDELCIVTGELSAVTKKKFDALPNVFNLLMQAKDNA